MASFFKLILFVLAAILARSILRHWLGQKNSPARQAGQSNQAQTGGRLIQDPQCGTYVAPELAIPARTGDQTLHFCSQECREQFLKAEQH